MGNKIAAELQVLRIKPIESMKESQKRRPVLTLLKVWAAQRAKT